MVEVSGVYEGDLRCVAVHGPSGSKLITDAPVDNEGQGRHFSPTDLVASALGTCVLTILGIVARRRGVDIRGSRFDVKKRMVADPKRRIAAIETTVLLPVRLGEEDRRALESAARACPIHHSLDERIDTPVEFVYE